MDMEIQKGHCTVLIFASKSCVQAWPRSEEYTHKLQGPTNYKGWRLNVKQEVKSFLHRSEDSHGECDVSSVWSDCV